MFDFYYEIEISNYQKNTMLVRFLLFRFLIILFSYFSRVNFEILEISLKWIIFTSSETFFDPHKLPSVDSTYSAWFEEDLEHQVVGSEGIKGPDG